MLRDKATYLSIAELRPENVGQVQDDLVLGVVCRGRSNIRIYTANLLPFTLWGTLVPYTYMISIRQVSKKDWTRRAPETHSLQRLMIVVDKVVGCPLCGL